MSTSQVVRLDDYRSRRNERLHRALTLSGWRKAERTRTALLARALEIAGADRAVSFWVDEYQAGAIHIDRCVDLGSDTPRRAVSPDLVERAYDHGFPGMIDSPDARRPGALLFPEAPNSSVLLSIGSDGTQSWFVLVDSLTPRARLDVRQREQLMFLAGELSTVLLHEDHQMWQGARGTFERTREEAFAGWGVLGDLAEGTLSEADRPAVNIRFLTARLVKTFIDDGLFIDPVGLADQIGHIRTDMAAIADRDEEFGLVDQVLTALERSDLKGLSQAVLVLGDYYWSCRYLHAARDVYLSAHELAVHLADAEQAALSAWGLGRASRHAVDWDGAFRWYNIAADIARTLDQRGHYGRVLDGLANALRDRGNLKKARTVLAEALDLANADKDADLRANVFHTLMTVEKIAGATGRAIAYGWEAVQAQPDSQAKMVALADLGSVFMEAGQYDDAEQALQLVLREGTIKDAEVMAISTLSQVAAIRGNRSEFIRLCSSLEDAEWHQASNIIRGQVMLDRGVSWARLGEAEKARDCLEWALAFGEGQGVSKVVLDADHALGQLDDGSLANEPVTVDEELSNDNCVQHVREDLQRYADQLACC
jgi:tetratricopeptide (TPR) repeat protein